MLCDCVACLPQFLCSCVACPQFHCSCVACPSSWFMRFLPEVLVHGLWFACPNSRCVHRLPVVLVRALLAQSPGMLVACPANLVHVFLVCPKFFVCASLARGPGFWFVVCLFKFTMCASLARSRGSCVACLPQFLCSCVACPKF